MIKKWIPMGAVALLVPFLAAQVAQVNMNPGLWEITTTTEMVGMPGAGPPPLTHTQCITAEDLVPQSEEASEVCTVSDINTEGNTISWKITCGGQGGGMEGTGTITYNGDTMEGTMEMAMPMTGMQIKNTLVGKRIGECEGGGG
jgi:hypothetical protein